MDTIKHTLTLYPSKSSEVTTKSQTFQKTIRLLAEHNSIWHFAIYQSKDSSPLNAIKYILKHLQHTFQLLIYHTQALYPSKSSKITTKSQRFQKIIRLLADHNSIWHFAITNKTLFASIRNQIYSKASSTHFSSINLSNLCALPIKSLRDHYWIKDI